MPEKLLCVCLCYIFALYKTYLSFCFCIFVYVCVCRFSSLAKKTQSVIQTLKKDGVLTAELEENLRSCRSADELDHVVRITLLCLSNIYNLNVIWRFHSGFQYYLSTPECGSYTSPYQHLSPVLVSLSVVYSL